MLVNCPNLLFKFLKFYFWIIITTYFFSYSSKSFHLPLLFSFKLMASSFPHLLFHAYMSMYVNSYSQCRLFSTYNVLWIHVLRAENLALDNNTTSSTSNFPQLATVLVFFFLCGWGLKDFIKILLWRWH